MICDIFLYEMLYLVWGNLPLTNFDNSSRVPHQSGVIIETNKNSWWYRNL